MNKEWILRRRPGGSWYVSQSEKTKETEVRLVRKDDYDKAVIEIESLKKMAFQWQTAAMDLSKKLNELGIE
jgi:hypothetical protein